MVEHATWVGPTAGRNLEALELAAAEVQKASAQLSLAKAQWLSSFEKAREVEVAASREEGGEHGELLENRDSS